MKHAVYHRRYTRAFVPFSTFGTVSCGGDFEDFGAAVACVTNMQWFVAVWLFGSVLSRGCFCVGVRFYFVWCDVAHVRVRPVTRCRLILFYDVRLVTYLSQNADRRHGGCAATRCSEHTGGLYRATIGNVHTLDRGLCCKKMYCVQCGIYCLLQ